MDTHLDALASLLEADEQWLMRRVLGYAQELQYTRYTSTLEEAWRVSIQGLTDSLVLAIGAHGWDLEIAAEGDLAADPAAAFGIEEARLHRSRGVTLPMFLALMKYYRQSYLDLVSARIDEPTRELYLHAVHRFFDRVEIAFCDEWQRPNVSERLRTLQERTRTMTNEKNKYLTVFDSLRTPVLLFDDQGRIDNANAVAARSFGLGAGSGAAYYSGVGRGQAFAPLADDVAAFLSAGEGEADMERALETSDGQKHYLVSFKRMLDVSGKFTGFTAIFTDVSEHKQAEEVLRSLSLRDDLTALCNRRGFLVLASQQVALAARLGTSYRMVFMDVDNMKAINDRHGHGAGDTALRDVAGLLVSTLRASDVVGRIGGDEFAALLIGGEETLIAVRRVEDALREFNAQAERPCSLELSIGYAEHSADSKRGIEELLEEADAHMYARKKQRQRGAS